MVLGPSINPSFRFRNDPIGLNSVYGLNALVARLLLGRWLPDSVQINK